MGVLGFWIQWFGPGGRETRFLRSLVASAKGFVKGNVGAAIQWS